MILWINNQWKRCNQKTNCKCCRVNSENSIMIYFRVWKVQGVTERKIILTNKAILLTRKSKKSKKLSLKIFPPTWRKNFAVWSTKTKKNINPCHLKIFKKRDFVWRGVKKINSNWSQIPRNILSTGLGVWKCSDQMKKTYVGI